MKLLYWLATPWPLLGFLWPALVPGMLFMYFEMISFLLTYTVAPGGCLAYPEGYIYEVCMELWEFRPIAFFFDTLLDMLAVGFWEEPPMLMKMLLLGLCTKL